MPFTCDLRTDFSLQQLVDLHRAGQPVVKTPHVGNAYPNNLACASVGLPMLFVDHTVSGKDRNFHPQCVIVNGQSEVIADHGQLLTHATVAKSATIVDARLFPVGAKVADCHMEAINQAVQRVAKPRL